MRIRAVLFDIGQTLIDYLPLDHLAGIRKLNCKDLGVDEGVLERIYDIYLKERVQARVDLREATLTYAVERALQDFGIFLNKKQRSELIRRIHFFQTGKATLCAGAKEILEIVKSQDLKMGLISNTPFPGYLDERNLRRLKILSYFEARVWSADFGLKKPHPAIFGEALRRLGVEPAEAIYIGDDYERDVPTPRSLEMETIWVNKKGGRREDFQGWQVLDLFQIPWVLAVILKEDKN